MSTASNLPEDAMYEYVPSAAGSIVFLVIFALLAIVHGFFVFKSKKWWMTLAVVGGLGEVAGWVGRYLSSTDAANVNYFLTQQVALVMSPCFFSAAMYWAIGDLIRAMGPRSSRLSPKWLLAIFITADLVSIGIQGAGGGLAAGAIDGTTSLSLGTNIFLAGIAIQLAVMVFFDILVIDIILRSIKISRESPEAGRQVSGADSTATLVLGFKLTSLAAVKMLIGGITIGSVFIIIRQIYRCIEMAQGWTGYLISHESYFFGLDGMPMAVTLIALFTFYPRFGSTQEDGGFIEKKESV